MIDTHRHDEIKAGSEREFGFVFTAVFITIALWPLLDGKPVKLWALIIAASFFVCTCIAASLLRPLNILWHKFGLLLGRIVVPVMMSILFFFGVTPVSIIMRLFGQDPLRLRFDPDATSYWISRDENNNPMGSMQRQF